MHQNSLEAYKEIKPVIEGNRRKVYEIILKNKAITAKEIAAKLNWGINCVTPRICELRESGMIVESGNVKNDLGITVSLYSPITEGGII